MPYDRVVAGSWYIRAVCPGGGGELVRAVCPGAHGNAQVGGANSIGWLSPDCYEDLAT